MLKWWFQTKYDRLIEAICAGNEAEAQKLIARMGTNELSKVNNDGDTTLSLAVLYRLEKVCVLLIDKISEQDINHVNNNGSMALTWAASKGLDKVCEMLIPKMSEQVTNNGETALNIAKNKGVKYIYDLLHKIDGFQKLADGINDKVATNIVINAKDKAIIKDTIEEIIHKAKGLNNTTDIDKITASMQGLIVDKSTKLKIMTIENQLNEIIDNQNINDDISMLGGDNTFVPAAG
ncbi:MAG: ankyrin repeat domain-containing protein [Rickettsia endosymbiont of Glossina mortisans submortisans]|nr:ankyrin repeat domain-containing protein [Rickettsia endosymbiont of Glossina mortisans submortisans]